ncbi:MAG: alpha-ketoglutarate-dependent dioxygenase AlkB [Actinobacteria bacterium]|nr:alpha-ketoglutarate-dependent dioxygenase AlkB [Actinomycetota bacterium]
MGTAAERSDPPRAATGSLGSVDRVVPAFQGSLLAAGAPEADASFSSAERRDLGDAAWIEVVPGWLAGSDTLFTHLVAEVHWQRREVRMYDRLLPEPRLTAWWDDGPATPGLPAVVARMGDLLDRRYGVHFDALGANLYRDGRDSVAWHGDRHLRRVPVSTVAVLSLGEPRRFLLRPAPDAGTRAPSVRLDLCGGDLLVMGGTCQRTWQHCVPKLARVTGPRMSLTFRERTPYEVDEDAADAR